MTPNHNNEDGNALRGLVYGLAFSAIIWAVFIGLVLWLK